MPAATLAYLAVARHSYLVQHTTVSVTYGVGVQPRGARRSEAGLLRTEKARELAMFLEQHVSLSCDSCLFSAFANETISDNVEATLCVCTGRGNRTSSTMTPPANAKPYNRLLQLHTVVSSRSALLLSRGWRSLTPS